MHGGHVVVKEGKSTVRFVVRIVKFFNIAPLCRRVEIFVPVRAGLFVMEAKGVEKLVRDQFRHPPLDLGPLTTPNHAELRHSSTRGIVVSLNVDVVNVRRGFGDESDAGFGFDVENGFGNFCSVRGVEVGVEGVRNAAVRPFGAFEIGITRGVVGLLKILD